MILLTVFLNEDYGIMPYFPNYDDSLKLSVSYYTNSSYPFVSGCFKGFCVHAGTYKGFVKDSTFFLRDHSKVIDTITSSKKDVQEWAILNRYFYTGMFYMGFEVGLIRENYSSTLKSRRNAFPDNSLSLGHVIQGILMGSVIGLNYKNFNTYALIRYRRFNKDSTVSSGDTTGWFITVPEGEKNALEVLLGIRFYGYFVGFYRRDNLGLWVSRTSKFEKIVYKFGAGYTGKYPTVYGGVGFDFNMIRVMIGSAYLNGPILQISLKVSP